MQLEGRLTRRQTSVEALVEGDSRQAGTPPRGTPHSLPSILILAKSGVDGP